MRRAMHGAFLVIGVLAILGIIGLFVARAHTAYRLNRILADLRRQGQPISLAELYGQPLRGSNAAPIYQGVASQVKRLSERLGKVDWLTQAGQAAPGRRQPDASLHRLLADHARLLETLRRGARADTCRFPQPRPTMQGVAEAQAGRGRLLRGICRTLSASAMDRAAHGDRPGAYADLALLLRVPAQSQQMGVLDHLVGHACQMIAVSAAQAVCATLPPGPGEAALLLGRLAAIQPYRQLQDALVGERAQALDTERMIERDYRASAARTPGGEAKWRVVMLVGRPWIDAGMGEYLQRMGRAIPLSGQPGREASRRLAAKKKHRSLLLADLLLGPVPDIRQATDREAASINVARWGVVVDLYRQEHGRYPATLAEAARAFPKVAPQAERTWLDPFTGKVPVYRVMSAGYSLYSLGANCRDDGGRWKYADHADDLAWQVAQRN